MSRTVVDRKFEYHDSQNSPARYIYRTRRQNMAIANTVFKLIVDYLYDLANIVVHSLFSANLSAKLTMGQPVCALSHVFG